MKKIFCYFFLFISFTISAQNEIKIMTYNIHDYTPYNPTQSNPFRLDWDNPALKFVINRINPDILVCQEVRDQASVNQLLEYVLENKYKAADFIESTNINSVLFYKEDKFSSLGNIVHPAETRPINEFPIVYKATNDTLLIFSVHLKANTLIGDNSDNIRRRGIAIDSLRKRTSQLPANKNFVVLGDFNTLFGSEPAIQKLIDKSNKGYALDPLNAIGEWGDNPDYAFTHTMYSENLTVRFDMIFISQAVYDIGGIEYVRDSYTIVGNDGKHFGKSINSGYNYWGKELVDSLISASDHLPVFIKLRFSPSVSIEKENIYQNFVLKQNYPNPFNSETKIQYQIPYSTFVTIKLYDILGKEISTLINEYKTAGTYEFTFNAEKAGISAGIYFYRIQTEKFQNTKMMVYLK